jgi:hypothetical protein
MRRHQVFVDWYNFVRGEAAYAASVARTGLRLDIKPESWTHTEGILAKVMTMKERQALAAAAVLGVLAVLALLSDGPRGGRAAMLQARRTALWDLEEGGPTDADQGFNYNPVVIDDAVSRRGYPSLVTGWREWGCDGDRESLETEYDCVNHPDNHAAGFDDDYWYDSYGKGGRFTGHFTEGLDI